MALNILYSKPGHLIRRAHQIAVALFMEECAGYDITPVQYATLVAIGATPGIAAIQLSAIVAFDPATLGKVIERLEAKKLVSRRMTAADKRAKSLFLTKEGQALCIFAGANSIFYGDKLLTAKNPGVDADRALMDELGLVAQSPRIVEGVEQGCEMACLS